MGARFRRRQPDLNVKQPRHASAVSRRVRPSFAGNSCAPQILRSSNEEGAGKAGCPLHPWPACNKKSTRQQPQVHRNQPAFPARMVLTVSFALSSATNSFCHRRQRIKTCLSPVGPTHLRRLSISNGCQDHTTSPYAATSPNVSTGHVPPAESFSEGVEAPFVRAPVVRSQTKARPAIADSRPTLPRPPHPTARP